MAGLILLDRDGVINEMHIDPEAGSIDSPLNLEQIRLNSVNIAALQKLAPTHKFVIVTNQPAAAKGKVNKALLEQVHNQIVSLLQAHGLTIEKSYICWHRAEDHCACRKPKPGMLQQALKDFPASSVWMIGDGVTDIQAGIAVGAKTVFLGPQKCDHCKIFENMGIQPTLWGKNLSSLVDDILKDANV